MGAKLRSAISEAKEAGVDKGEVAEAELRLSQLNDEQEVGNRVSPALSELLHKAKPEWRAKVLDAAVDKLVDVGVVNIQGLTAALSYDGPAESSLNELLRNKGHKAFAEETIRSLQEVLTILHPDKFVDERPAQIFR